MYIGRGPVKGRSDRGARRAQQERPGRYLWAFLQKGPNLKSHTKSQKSVLKKKERCTPTLKKKKGVHQKHKGAHQLSKVNSKKKKGVLKN
jgi:hypothetical protein